jgi:hypothetical protein
MCICVGVCVCVSSKISLTIFPILFHDKKTLHLTFDKMKQKQNVGSCSLHFQFMLSIK